MTAQEELKLALLRIRQLELELRDARKTIAALRGDCWRRRKKIKPYCGEEGK